MDTRPQNATDAQFSLPFALACLAYRIPRHRWSAGDTLTNPALLAQARRPVLQVEVITRGEIVVGERIAFPLGCAEHPLEESGIMAKLSENLSSRFAPADITQVTAALYQIEQCRAVIGQGIDTASIECGYALMGN
ncbi:hypothetical protein [Pectobacterium parmentieri]|uniref:hypothetical protein n=1 Tax=Pectobacterium parmentieri TaxID=1905730 RepID=UPI0004732922|nr:hypothetical protein [Pectobacterium parmentieri]